MHKRGRKKSSSSSTELGDIHLKDVQSGQSLLKTNYKKKHNLHNAYNKNKAQAMEFKMKTKLKMIPKEVKNQGNQKIANSPKEKLEYSKVEITTGKGLAVPICEGEEIVSKQIILLYLNYLRTYFHL